MNSERFMFENIDEEQLLQAIYFYDLLTNQKYPAHNYELLQVDSDYRNIMADKAMERVGISDSIKWHESNKTRCFFNKHSNQMIQWSGARISPFYRPRTIMITAIDFDEIKSGTLIMPIDIERTNSSYHWRGVIKASTSADNILDSFLIPGWALCNIIDQNKIFEEYFKKAQ